MMTNNAKLPDISTLIQAGFNPKTGLPIKLGDEDKCMLKSEIKKNLRIKDEQVALNRYKWYNLPSGLDGQLLERILYYKGQAAFFYIDTNETFYFLPYALNGTIDVYGRFMGITPIAFGNGTTDNEKDKPWIEGLVRKPVYDIVLDLDENTFKEGCVLLSDYSKQLGQTNISRSVLQDTIIDMEAEALPFARTNLISNSGIRGMRVNDEDQQAQVALASKSLTNAALTGKPWVPIVGNTEFQDLTANGINKSEEYLLYMQSLDNLRLSMYGIGEGGLFEKKAHVLQSEQAMNAGNEQLIYQDGLTLRQKFCDIVNSIWGLGIWCEASELVTGMDTNMDGVIMDNQDQSGIPNEQPQEVITDDMQQ